MKRLTQKRWFSFFKSGKAKMCLDITGYTQIRDSKTDPRGERFYLVGEAVEKLAAYEDAEEQGLLLRLPCKVGDKIYRIGTMCDFGENPSDICDDTDCEECFYDKALVIKEGIAKEYHIRRFLEGNSKYDFLTKEEAEQALKKIQEGT